MALTMGSMRAASLIAEGLGKDGWIALESFRTLLSKAHRNGIGESGGDSRRRMASSTGKTSMPRGPG